MYVCSLRARCTNTDQNRLIKLGSNHGKARLTLYFYYQGVVGSLLISILIRVYATRLIRIKSSPIEDLHYSKRLWEAAIHEISYNVVY